MKYAAKKLNSGQWAVFAGKQYFISTVTDDKEYAEERALVMSAAWHQIQMDKVHKELIKKGFVVEDSRDEYSYLA